MGPNGDLVTHTHHNGPHHGHMPAASTGAGPNALGAYSSSIPPQIVIPRARHNQVNYAVHRGQVSERFIDLASLLFQLTFISAHFELTLTNDHSIYINLLDYLIAIQVYMW